MTAGNQEQAFAKCLIVNADDYGYTAGVSAGIRRAHLEGIVTSTSVMMTMPYAVAELARLRSETPTLGAGVHLTVTEGRPFRLARFFSPGHLHSELAGSPVAELRSEWRAQIDAFCATGLSLTHLDSHHHAAYRRGNALSVLFELARDCGVPVRQPYPLGDTEADALATRFATAGIRHPSRFVDVFHKKPTTADLLRSIETLPDGVTEFMVHPAVVDDELRQLSPNFALQRAIELEALTEPSVRAAVQRHGIRLASFSVLAD